MVRFELTLPRNIKQTKLPTEFHPYKETRMQNPGLFNRVF
jgi:hypothetical protein